MSSHSRKFFQVAGVALSVFFFLFSFAYAEKMEHKSEGRGHKKGQGYYGKMKGHSGHEKGHRKGMHIFGKYWRNTLTDEQKVKIDKMHLTVKKDTAVLGAQLDLKKTELKTIVISDNPKISDINKKIKEIVSIKQKIMEIKYAHKVEMRKALTKEQRVSFDMGLLSRRGKGHKKSH